MAVKKNIYGGRVRGRIKDDGTFAPYIMDEKPIIPVKETKPTGLFKGSDAANNWSLSTGNDFLDFITRVNAGIWGTAAEATTNVARGVTNMVEGIDDWRKNRVADVQDMFGYSKEAEKTRRESEEQWGINKDLDKFAQTMNTTSVLGDFSDQVFQGVGSSVFAMGTGAIGSMLSGGSSLIASIASLGSMDIGASGNAENEARLTMMAEMKEKGYTKEQINNASRWYGLLSGGAETLSEMMFGSIAKGSKVLGIGKGLFDSADDAVIHTLTNKIQNDLVKTLVQSGLKATGEGIEEVVSGFLNAAAKKVTYMKDEDFWKLVQDEKLWESFLSGTLSAYITQTPGIYKNASNTVKGLHQDYITDLSNNEQTVIDKIVEQRMKQDSKGLLKENQIRREVTDQMKNLKLTTKEISRALGKEKLTGNMADSFLNQIVTNEHSRFINTQNELKNIKTEKQVELAKDLNVLNNSSIVHDLYNELNAIQGVNNSQQYHLTTTEGLYRMGELKKNSKGEYTLNNGKPYVPRALNYKDGAIYVNADVGLQSGTQAVFHEMFEGFKKASPKEYEQFKTMVREIVGEKAIQEEMAKYKDMYEGLYDEKLAKTLEDEIINDKFGEMAESEQFINRLADNRNIFERIIDSIKKMIKYIKGTPEEKNLIKLKDNLEKKFNELYKKTDFSKNAKGKTAFSIVKLDNANLTTSKEAYKSSPKDGTIRLYTNTPYRNIESILKDGLRTDIGRTHKEYEGNMLWFETTPDLQGYGGTTIAVDVPYTTNMEKVNDTQYTVYDNISPEDIVFVDRPIMYDFRTSDIEDLLAKWGEKDFKEVFDRALKNGDAYVTSEEMESLLDSFKNDLGEIDISNNIPYNKREKTNFDFDVQEGDLVNEFHDSLNPSEWKRHSEIMRNVLGSTYGTFDRTDVIGKKLVSTIFENGKEQVYNVIEVDGDVSPLIDFIKEVANEYGYSAREVQDVVEEMYGKENVSIYDSTTRQFEPVSEKRGDSRLFVGEDSKFDGRTIEEGNWPYNKKTEVEQSTFLNAKEYNTSNKNATFTEQRLDNIISESISKWDDNYAKAYVVTMTPDQFLGLTASENTMDRLQSEVEELDTNKLANERQNIFLDVNMETGKVTGHEGRHRMLALKNAGIENVEMVIYPDSGTYDRYNAPRLNEMNLIGQDFSAGKGTDTKIGEMIPVSKANVDEIKGRYNEDSKVKYSLSDNEVDNYVQEKGYTFQKNGNLKVNNLTDKQIKDLVKLYKQTGYEDVSADYLVENLKSGRMPIQREVADRFIEKELGHKPQYDTTQIFEDAEGNPLTKEQVEFYKDSGVRDIRGRLIPVYHRTNADFTVFDNSAGKQHGSKYGKGFYFSITPENYGNNTMKVYLNAKDGEFKYVPKMGYYIVQESNQIKNVDNTNPTSNPDIRYSLSVEEAHTGVDNRGEELTEGQQEYFKDSKVTDAEGNLITVYHTGSGENIPMNLVQFNEFNPVGTPDYRYGDQVVNFFTDSKDMSGSYVDQNYVMADTSRYYNVAGVESMIDYYNSSDMIEFSLRENNGKYELIDERDDGNVIHTFESEDDLFRNADRIVRAESGLNPDIDAEGIQYEGYVNITNPYIVDVKGESWNRIANENALEFKKEFKEKWDVPERQLDKLEGQTLNEINRDLTKLGWHLSTDEYGDLNLWSSNYKIGIDLLNVNDVLQEVRSDLDNDLKTPLTTNDVVFQVLAENKLGANYDGVIFENVVDYGGAQLGEETPNNVYVTFASNQFKGKMNFEPTSDSDIRYSLSKDGKLQDQNGNKVTLEASDTGTTNSLMAIHNLSESKLKGILELGGFPVPSIAILDTNKMAHSEFGDISVLFDKETINPKLRKNEVYDRDVWSPTFPRIEYEANEDVLKDVRKALGLDNYGNMDSIQQKASLDLYQENIENKLDSWDLDGLKETLNKSRDLQYAYLKSKGLIEPVTKTNQFNRDVSNEVLQQFVEQYQGMTPWSWDTPLNELSFEQTMELRDNIKRLVKPYLEEQFAQYGKDGKEVAKKELAKYDDYNKLADFIYSANSLSRNGADYQIIDEYETLKKASEIINKEEYAKWIDEKFNDVIKEKGIYNGKEIFTPMGNRRSFKATHNPVNLENLVKILSRGNTKGGQEKSIFGTGFGRISAQQAQRFNSIEDIKANQNRLMTREEATQIIEPLSVKLQNDTEALANYYNIDTYRSDYVNGMQAMDNASEMVEDFASGALTIDRFRKLLGEDYRISKDIPDSVLNNIIDDLNQTKNLPTDYFEAKPQRAVGLDEIQQIVIPNTIDAEFKKQLKDLGLKYTEYNPEVEGDRQRVINQFDDLKFSLTSNKNITPMDIAPVREGMFTYGGENIAPTRKTSQKSLEDMTADDINIDPFMRAIEEGAEREQGRRRIKDEINSKKEVFIPKERSGFKKFVDTLREMFVNKNVEIDNLSRDYKNPQIKFLADMLNSTAAEAQSNLNLAQTDNYGKTLGRALRQIFSDVRSKGLYDAFNDYLLHWSNIDRHRAGKGSNVDSKTSYKIIKEYEKKFPIFKELGKEIWNYSRNARHNLRDAGIISQDVSDMLGRMYPHYVPYISEGNDSYFKDISEIKPLGVIKRAKGGAVQENLLPVEEALTRYTYSQKKAVRQNDLYKEIVRTIGDNVELGGDVRTDYSSMADSLYRDKDGSYLTAYDNGEQVSTRISDELFRSLSGELENQVKDLEKRLSFITKPLQTVSKIRRDILTKWSLTFPVTNALKDAQDAVLNSKYTTDFLKNYPTALAELTQNTEIARQFKLLYGSGLDMGQYDVESGLYNPQKGAKNKNFLKGVENINELIELAPRFAEFKASLQNGATLQEAMYNAREITTNFSRGGVIAKAMNRNGFTFLNASIQGFSKFIRNFSGENGAKGVVSSLAKAVIFGVAPAVFNELAFGWGDDKDKDYEVIPDYIKDNYYLIKTSNGEFIRIPKGRMLSVFGSAARRTLEMAQGEEDSFKGFLKNVDSQIGINNPEENNIFAPLIQAYGSENGTAWYGGDIVPTRLQNKPKGEQYDASIDNMSIWLGEKLGISPYKLNYILDQYTGGVGDILLPLNTEEANSEGGILFPVIKDKFVVDSTTDNKYVSDFYTKNDEITVKANSDYATDEDKLRKKYMSHISSQMSELYKQRREIQASDLPKAEKYKQAQAIKSLINDLAEVGVKGYNNLDISGDYAVVNDDMGYYKNAKGDWTPIDQDDIMATEGMGLTDIEKSKYYGIKNDFYNIEQDYKTKTEGLSEEAKKPYSQEKKREIIDTIKASGLPNETKAYLYEDKYNDKLAEPMANLGMNMDNYLEYKAQNFVADKDSKGNSISGSKKQKIFNYVNQMNIPLAQKAILIKSEYETYDTYNFEIIEYVYNSNMSYEEKLDLLKKLGFNIDGNRVTW